MLAAAGGLGKTNKRLNERALRKDRRVDYRNRPLITLFPLVLRSLQTQDPKSGFAEPCACKDFGFLGPRQALC